VRYPNSFARPPALRATIGVLAVALLFALIFWFFGANVWHAILIGAGITTVALLGWIAMTIQVGDSPWLSRGRSNRAGSRSDISELSWSLRGNSGTAAVWRLRRIARQRLARHHLDLDNALDRSRIEQLIGRRAYVVLARGRRRQVRLRALLRCLDALDVLAAIDPADTVRATTPAPRARRRPLTFTRPRQRSARER
jgi:hypothetical protein